VTRIAQGIHRLGNGLVNSYLLEEAGEITIVDAGASGYWKHLPAELAAMGRSLGDVRAVLLTHAHTDHIGFAEKIRRERGLRIQVHELDAKLARGEEKPSEQSFGGMKPLPLLRFLAYGVTHGLLRTTYIAEVSTFGDGATLDAPGSPRVVHVPGHTKGSAALHVRSKDVLFVGDAFVTYSVLSGERGPQISPFTADVSEAYASLSRLDALEARLALPGHGEPWTGGVADALARVREHRPH
jgi:glyoxylase-like metal-dependent hydrolase (beta-lactamase superfamily II)